MDFKNNRYNASSAVSIGIGTDSLGACAELQRMPHDIHIRLTESGIPLSSLAAVLLNLFNGARGDDSAAVEAARRISLSAHVLWGAGFAPRMPPRYRRQTRSQNHKDQASPMPMLQTNQPVHAR